VAEALEKLLAEHILPYHNMPILGQEFRDEQLWTLEIDDVYKANYEALNQLFRTMQQGGEAKGEFTLEDALDMLDECGFYSQEQEKRIVVAFAQSKNLIIDEMEEFDSYTKLKRGEFYEFVGRAAHLLYTQPNR